MLLTFHSLAGVVIASEIPNTLIAWPVALVSHFVLDCFPHLDFFTDGVKLSRKIKLAIVGDFLLGLLIGLFFALRLQDNTLNIVGSCFFANFPDGLSAIWLFSQWRPWLVDLNLKIQSKLNFKAPLPWGMVAPVLLTVVFLCALWR